MDLLGPPPSASKHRHLAKDTREVINLLREVNAAEGDLLLVGDVADFYTSGRHVGLAKDASSMVCDRGPGSALDLGIAFALWTSALPSGWTTSSLTSMAKTTPCRRWRSAAGWG